MPPHHDDRVGSGPDRDLKGALRARLRSRRRSLRDETGPPDRDDHAARLAAHLSPLLAALPAGSTVASFTSLPTEPPTDAVNELIAALGHRLALPVLLPDNDLDWDAGDGDRLGRDAISAAALVLVPALAIGRDGSRLGQGGGSYDRALPRVGRSVPVIAIVHEHEVVDTVPRDAHDRDVDGVVTATSGLVLLSGGTGTPG